MTTYEGKIVPWADPEPFVVHFSNGGEIHFYKDGRTVSKLSNPDYAAEEFVKFVEKHYRAHILEAERRAEQRVRAEIGRDSERLDWLSSTLTEMNLHVKTVDIARHRFRSTVTISGPLPSSHFRKTIDAAREVG